MSINSTNKNRIKKWLENINSPKSKKVLLVYGKSGLGKYTAINETLNEMNYDVHVFYSIDFLNKKEIRSSIEKMVNNKSIYMMMNRNKFKNAVIIRELEGLSKPHYLKFIIEIITN